MIFFDLLLHFPSRGSHCSLICSSFKLWWLSLTSGSLPESKADLPACGSCSSSTRSKWWSFDGCIHKQVKITRWKIRNGARDSYISNQSGGCSIREKEKEKGESQCELVGMFHLIRTCLGVICLPWNLHVSGVKSSDQSEGDGWRW